MKQLSPRLTEQKNALEASAPYLLLFEIAKDAADTERYYFASGVDQVEFDGRTYEPFPITIGDVDEDGEGRLTSIRCSVSNIARVLMPEMETTDGFRGHACRILIVYADHLDDPTSAIVHVGKIRGPAHDSKSVTFEVGPAPFLEIEAPARRYAKRCNFAYKGRWCGYVGAIEDCDHTLNGANGCVAHGYANGAAVPRFGGHPVIPEAN